MLKCPNVHSEQWKALINKIGEVNAMREFLTYGDIPSADNYESDPNILKSIRVNTPQEIAEGLDKSLITRQEELKNQAFVQSLFMASLGDLAPGKKLNITPVEAFKQTIQALSSIKKKLELASTSIIKDEASFQKNSKDPKVLALIPILEHIKTYDEFQKSIEKYTDLVNNFSKYQTMVLTGLLSKGIKIVGNKENRIEAVETKDVTDEQDDVQDGAVTQALEQSKQFEATAFETNPRDTASIRLRAFIQTIPTGNHEFGIPEYANPDDVMSDILEAGSKISLTGFTDSNTKLNQFLTQLSKKASSRSYIKRLISKITEFRSKNEWDKINDILTFATKAYAMESILLYTTQKTGEALETIKNVKVIGSNRDTIVEQVFRDWVIKHQTSSFFRRTATGELMINPTKLKELESIINEAVGLDITGKKAKFGEFFKVLGINITKEEVNYISDKYQGSSSFANIFGANNLMQFIYDQYKDNLEIPYDKQYGLGKEKGIREIAQLYYDSNPGRYPVVSSRTADGKSKYLYILPNYIENKKREWANGDYSDLFGSPLARPNSEFWNGVRNGNKTFTLGYFSGIKEQDRNNDGKVRKDFTYKDQVEAMLLAHQSDMNTGTYTIFTLSDKTTSVENKISKQFFLSNKTGDVILGHGREYTINELGHIQFTTRFLENLFNQVVEPEMSRIQAAIKQTGKINVENFDIASRLFYFMPFINSHPELEEFRKAVYSGTKPDTMGSEMRTKVASIIMEAMNRSVMDQLEEFKKYGIITKNKNGNIEFPGFFNEYVNNWKKTKLEGINLAILMMLDFKLNYIHSQIKTIQFLRFDPMTNFKGKIPEGVTDISEIDPLVREALVNTTWDEFSKRAAALIAPGSQGNWFWPKLDGTIYTTKPTYRAITVEDVVKKINGQKNEIADAQEYVTLQEYIDHLMSEGKIDLPTWNSIHTKIQRAGPGGHYQLTKEELKSILHPTKPVHVNDVTEEGGLNRIDYVKSSRYPLIPQHEVGSERDKVRIFMETNNIQSLNFASAKKLGRPGLRISLFDKTGNTFIEPSKEDIDKATQELSRDGLRTQQEIPHQHDTVTTVSQLNRTILDGLLGSIFPSFKGLEDISGESLKQLKENLRSRLFEMNAEELGKDLGDLEESHRGLYKMLRKTILSDTTGSYGSNDLRALELDEKGFFKIPLEAQAKTVKYQGLINSMINKNVMLKTEGASFIQVSGVGSRFTMDTLSKGVKSDIIWLDKYYEEGKEKSLDYISMDDGLVKPAQVIVSQYLRDEEGNIIDLSNYITEKNGHKILDTSKFSPEMFQLVGTRIPNQSHPSTLPIEVVGFLPDYMENAIIVPDGITGQMGSDFDVDKLYTYISKHEITRDKSGKITHYGPVKYDLIKAGTNVDGLSREQLEQLYYDLHWAVLTHPDAYAKITKSVDMPEVSNMKEQRAKLLKEYGVEPDRGANLPLDFSTSIKRYNDNRGGKDGVSVFATLISAQADLQDKILTLGFLTEEGPVINPVNIKLSKKSPVVELRYLGQTGISYSKLSKEARSISDLLNIGFTESVDNSKNQNLREFNWDEKAMGAVGTFVMLSSESKEVVPIDFVMNLTSQNSIYDLFDLIDRKQDSFGEFQSDATKKAITELQAKIAETINTLNPDKYIDVQAELLAQEDRDTVLDPETLSDMWVVGQILKLSPNLEGQLELPQLKDFAKKNPEYGSVQELLTKYYTVQYDSLNLFSRLNNMGKELMTILGASYIYTKGIGPDIYTAKQKLLQLAKLANSSEFLHIEGIMGKVFKDPDSGHVSINPKGEIGHSILHSLVKAQDIYQKLYPISSGASFQELLDKMLEAQGIEDISELGREKFITLHKDVFNAIKSYLYTSPNLQLSGDPRDQRVDLINGDTSIGKRILDLTEDKKYANNGFLRNIEITQGYKSLAYTLSFRAPFGGEVNEAQALSGFYELALDENPEVQQLAKDLAIYPFITGDAGNLARFIPIDYYTSDEDFSRAISSISTEFVNHLSYDGGAMYGLVQQIVQNNAAKYAKRATYQSVISIFGDVRHSLLKEILRPQIGLAKLEKVPSFTLTEGNISSREGGAKLLNYLTIPLTSDMAKYAASLELDPKEIKVFAPYILLTDSSTNSLTGESRKTQYLYRRTTGAITTDGVARYERINILGYKNIKEYSMTDQTLISSIADNNVYEDYEDSDSNDDIQDVPPQSPITTDPNTSPLPSKNQEEVSSSQVKGINISTRSSDPLGRALTNPTWGSKKDGKDYFDVESAYKANKSKNSDSTKALQEDKNTMYNLILEKFKRAPELVEQIKERGGVLFLEASEHTIGVKGSRWEGKGMDSAFIQVLVKAYEKSISNLNLTNTQELNPSSYKNYSGGAEGSDKAWDSIGREFGVTEHTHYRPEDLTKLSTGQTRSLEEKYQKAARDMGRPIMAADSFVGKLVRRDFLQVVKADAVFAISKILQPGEKDKRGYLNKTSHEVVEGGTGYAVQMAINEGKPVYVFDQEKDKWFKWNNDSFQIVDTPILTKNFAGIGTREINTEGRQAIIDVYAKTFSSTQEEDSPVKDSTMKVSTERINTNEVLSTGRQKAIMEQINSELLNEAALSSLKGLVEIMYHNTNPFFKSVLEVLGKTGDKGVKDANIVIDNKVKDPGSYDPYTKTITINPKLAMKGATDLQEARDMIHTVIIHELMHHLTAQMLLADPKTLTSEQLKWTKAVKNVFSKIQEKMLKSEEHGEKLKEVINRLSSGSLSSEADKSMYYGLTNVHEFVSMLMSDKGFQEFMNNTPYEGKTSVLKKFIEMVTNLLKALGIEINDDSALKRGMADIVGLISVRDQQSGIESEEENPRAKLLSANFEKVVEQLNISKICN